MSEELIALKQSQRAVWSAGNWDAVADNIRPAGSDLIDRVGVASGMTVLDVGTGSGGSVAIPAARLGADVVGADLTPELFPAARRRAADAGVTVEWIAADAEALPFEDGRFDRVFSTFGHMFAPRHAVAAAELARVCRPGGFVATTTWLPEGFSGQLFEVLGGHAPPRPASAESPVAWGSEEHVRTMFEPHGLSLEFDTGELVIEDQSVEEFVVFYEEHFGPVVALKGLLGDRWAAARRDMVDLVTRFNGAQDGTVRVPAAYLITIGRKPGGAGGGR